MSNFVQKGDIRSALVGFASVMVLAAVITFYIRTDHREEIPDTETESTLLHPDPPGGRSKFDFTTGVNRFSITRSIGIAASHELGLAKMSDESLMGFLNDLRTREEEEAWWKSVLSEIALTDIDRALDLARKAPAYVRGETRIAQAIASERGGDGLLQLAGSAIASKALAAGLGELNSGEVGAVLEALVETRGAFGTEEMRELLNSRDQWKPEDAELLSAALDPTHWSLPPTSNFRGIALCLGNCNIGVDVIHEKLLAFCQGNTALAAGTMGGIQLTQAQASGEGKTVQELFDELRGSAASKDQADKLLSRYAWGRTLSQGGVDSLDWALSLEGDNDRQISTRTILDRFIGSDGIMRETLYSELEKKIANEPDSKIWPAMNEWLAELAENRPDARNDFFEGLPNSVKTRLENLDGSPDKP